MLVDSDELNLAEDMNSLQLLIGDCRERMAQLDEASINLVVTSPPYPNMRMPYGDRFTEGSYIEFSRDWIAHAARVLAPTGSLWINVGWMADGHGGRIPLPYLLFPVCRELGLILQQEIVWAKPNRPAPTPKRFTTRTERWMWFTKCSKGHTFNIDAVRTPHAENRSCDPRNNPLGANPTDVWEFAPVNGRSSSRPKHPCPYPIEMVERVVLACSDAGGVVLDPFHGSGSTGMAAIAHGRRYIGIEASPTYVEDSYQRLWEERERAHASELRRLGETLPSPANDAASGDALASKSRQRRSSRKARNQGSLGFRHRSAFRLLTASNAKTPKGERSGYFTAALYLSPHTTAGGSTVCPHSTPECRRRCLSNSGLLRLPKSTEARKRRTRLWHEERARFIDLLARDVDKLREIASAEGLKPALRLNGTSDIPFERWIELPQDVALYDYTRTPIEHRRNRPDNYRLTYSVASADEWVRGFRYLREGQSIAVVVPPDTQRQLAGKQWMAGGISGSYLDGDSHDLRFLDPARSVVLLKPKGDAGELVCTDPQDALRKAATRAVAA